MYFNVRQTKSISLAMIISIVLHIVFFIFLALMKFQNGYNIKEKVSIALVKEKDTKLNRRSMPVKEIPSFTESPQKYDLGTMAKIEIANTPSPLVYTEKEFPTAISGFESLPYEAARKIDLSTKLYKPDAHRTDISIKEVSPKPVNPKIDVVDGSKFVKESPLEIKKPEIKFAEEKNKILQNYLASVRKKIESKKRYPISARNANIEGRAEVKLTILKDGQLDKVEIIRSSGSEILDNSALESIQKASPFPPIPDSLGQEKIEVSISLVYNLEKSR
ncbi:MAG: energy transducer TonB [Candidatus Poribacteria bacterium]